MYRFFIILLFPFSLAAQDLTGFWKGQLLTTGSKAELELVITAEGDKLSGYTLTRFVFEGVENVGVKELKIKQKNGTLLIEDGELVFHNYSTPPRRVKLLGELRYQQKKKDQTLAGTFATRSLDMRDASTYNGIIQLKKQDDVAGSRLIAKLDELKLSGSLSFLPRNTTTVARTTITTGTVTTDAMAVKEMETKDSLRHPAIQNKTVAMEAVKKETPPATTPAKAITNVSVVPPPAALLAQRKTEIIREIGFVSDSLVLSLYDNGSVDGDTVSVVVNGQVVLPRKRLTAAAITTTIYAADFTADSLQLIMYAENLGAVPPNTGLLIIQDGEERYEIRFAGDLQKSSGVLLRKKKRA